MRAVVEWTRRLRNVEIWENAFTLDLLVHEGACRGALISHERRGKMLVWAKQTIVCTGGAGQLYRETTNPAVATAAEVTRVASVNPIAAIRPVRTPT